MGARCHQSIWTTIHLLCATSSRLHPHFDMYFFEVTAMIASKLFPRVQKVFVVSDLWDTVVNDPTPQDVLCVSNKICAGQRIDTTHKGCTGRGGIDSEK